MNEGGFVERHEIWSEEQRRLAAEVLARIDREGVEIVRLSFADQHGILRGKTVVADALPGVFAAGLGAPISLIAKDTAHRTVYPLWKSAAAAGMAEGAGVGDVVLVPDPATFQVLPWTDKTGWLLCDVHFTDGRPVPFSPRRIAKAAIGKLADQGYDYVSGLEVEFHLYRLKDAKLEAEHATQPGTAPEVGLVNQGFQYLTEIRMDEVEPLLDILRVNLQGLGLPVRTLEVEFGPSQVEITMQPAGGIATADAMTLFRSAVKQVCRRHGYHATFMCRPALPNAFSSGWHLHQSFIDRRTGRNAFIPDEPGQPLSKVGRQFVAGVLRHARASCVFTTPTINGYKRYRPYTMAPDRILWGRDNRGAMLRVIGGPGDSATRVENRVGEPAANPYFYLASQVLSGLQGMALGLEPDTPADAAYETEAPSLPKSLIEALAALREDRMYADELGEEFVKYILTIKEAEVARFLSEVTDWEQKEYFGLF